MNCNYFGNYIYVINKNKNPLVWWVVHAMQFKHVYSWAHQVLGVISSQIEIEKIFGVVGVIMNFQQFILRIKKLGYFILATKNWPNKVHVGCDGTIKPKNMLDL